MCGGHQMRNQACACFCLWTFLLLHVYAFTQELKISTRFMCVTFVWVCIAVKRHGDFRMKEFWSLLLVYTGVLLLLNHFRYGMYMCIYMFITRDARTRTLAQTQIPLILTTNTTSGKYNVVQLAHGTMLRILPKSLAKNVTMILHNCNNKKIWMLQINITLYAR